MKKLTMALAATALTTGTMTVGIVGADEAFAAGPFDGLKKKVKKAKKKAAEAEAVINEVERAEETGGRSVVEGATGVAAGSVSGPVVVRKNGRSGAACNANVSAMSNYPCTAPAPDNAGKAGPAPAKFTSQLKCANIGLGNAFVARAGEYTFSQGISTETRGGLVDRRGVGASNGCLFEGLGVGDVLYVEFDASRYKEHEYKIQCVSYNGTEQLDHVHGPRNNNYTGKDVMLHTGNSLGYEPTASGSNSDRSRAYDAHLKQRGRAMLTFNFQPLHTDKTGTDFYCQWFNKNTGESAIAMAFRRGPMGS